MTAMNTIEISTYPSAKDKKNK